MFRKDFFEWGVLLLLPCLYLFSSGKPAPPNFSDQLISQPPQQQSPLPPPEIYHWDTSKILNEINEIAPIKRRKDSLFYAWFKSSPNTADKDYIRDSLMWLQQEAFSLLVFKNLQTLPKTKQNLFHFSMILRMSLNLDTNRVQELFRQFPEILRKSAIGKDVSTRIRELSGINDGRNIKSLLASTNVIALNGQSTNVMKLLNNGCEQYILVFGASWCSPCRYQDKVIQRAIAGRPGNRYKIIHLSIDTNRKKWENSEKGATQERNAHLLTGGFEATLLKQLSIRGVPHYIVVDGNGNVLEDNKASVQRIVKRLKMLE